jgi:hypothetical protein
MYHIVWEGISPPDYMAFGDGLGWIRGYASNTSSDFFTTLFVADAPISNKKKRITDPQQRTASGIPVIPLGSDRSYLAVIVTFEGDTPR